MISDKDLAACCLRRGKPNYFAAGVLNFCVRYEYRCVHSALTTDL